MSILNVMRLLLLVMMLYLMVEHWIFFAGLLGLYIFAELGYRYTVNKRSQSEKATEKEIQND